jgi:hypothetical protein
MMKEGGKKKKTNASEMSASAAYRLTHKIRERERRRGFLSDKKNVPRVVSGEGSLNGEVVFVSSLV